MQKKIVTIALMLTLCCLLVGVAFAHAGGHGASADALRTWTNTATNERLAATLLFARAAQAHLESSDGRIVILPLAQLAEADRQYVAARQARVARLNAPRVSETSSSILPMLVMLLLAGAAGQWLYRRAGDATQRRIAYVSAALLLCSIAYTTSQHAQIRPSQTVPFDVFSPKVTL